LQRFGAALPCAKACNKERGKKMILEQTIAAMLTENTGTHMLDSGGANGRAWQQNIGKTIDDFRATPSATAEIYVREWKGETVAEVLPCVDVFHLLTGGAIELDELCREFNALPVEDWKGEFSGVSMAGSEWLDLHGFAANGEAFNTYNWAANHSTIMQGSELTLDGEYGEETYLLLQIHGGADARGGYTDARLFKLDDHAEVYNVLTEDCGFSADLSDVDTNTKDMFTGQTRDGFISLSWHGEWINSEGSAANNADLLAFATACGASVDTSTVRIAGDAYLDF
jgi:hypothetical protein